MCVLPVPELPTADVLAADDVFRAGEFQHKGLVERWEPQEVEAVEAFDGRELGLLDSSLDHPTFALDQFELRQAQQVAGVVDAFGGALPCKLVILAQEGW